MDYLQSGPGSGAMFSDYLQSGPGSGAMFSDYLQLCGALFAMGDELNEKTSQLIEVVSGSFFSGSCKAPLFR